MRRVLPLCVEISGEATVAGLLRRHRRHVRLPIQQTDRWQPAIAGSGKMTMAATPEGHWRLEAHFKPGDRWVYPRFALPEGIDLGQEDALVLRARCEKAAAVRVFLWEGDTGVGYLTSGSLIPADGQWHTALVRFADLALSGANAPDPDGRLDRGKVRRISIGLNSEAAENTLEVSELYVVGK